VARKLRCLVLGLRLQLVSDKTKRASTGAVIFAGRRDRSETISESNDVASTRKGSLPRVGAEEVRPAGTRVLEQAWF
jgi:hypothetical protein